MFLFLAILWLRKWSVLYVVSLSVFSALRPELTTPAVLLGTSAYVLLTDAAHRHVSRTPRRQLRYEDALWRHLTAPPAPTPDYRSAAERGHQQWLDDHGLYEVK